MFWKKAVSSPSRAAFPAVSAYLALLLAWSAWAGAGAEAAQVDARLDSTRMLIGDPLTLTVTVRADREAKILLPGLESSLGDFELLSTLPPERYEDEEGALLERRIFRITTFETGSSTIPPLEVVVSAADGSADTLLTGEMTVRVASLVSDTVGAEIRPLKGLLPVPRLWHRIAAWSAAALAVLVLAVLLWRRYLARRARIARGALGPVAPGRPAHLAALDELDRIKSLGLIEKGKIKLFHILVSDAIRRYIRDRFDVDAPDMTTWEIALHMERKNIEDGLRRAVEEFLQACDMVKFAKHQPPIVEINATFNRAYDIVEMSRPREAPVVDETVGNEPEGAAAAARNRGDEER